MDSFSITILVSVLTVGVTLIVAYKLRAWQERRMFWALIRDALGVRLNAALGIAGALVYLGVYLVGGKHLYFFYGRVIWLIAPAEMTLALVTALLVGLVVALFPYSLKKLGILKSQQSGWGIVGTLLAVIVSFCP